MILSWINAGHISYFRRGSPLLVGIKSATHLSTDYIPVLYSADLKQSPPVQKKKNGGLFNGASSANGDCGDGRSNSVTEFKTLTERAEVEYFFASDASAIIEHTNRVLYLEDDDVAYVTCEGGKGSSRRVILLKKNEQNYAGRFLNSFSHSTWNDWCPIFHE